MKKLVILAITLRLLVAALIFHPDIKTFNFQASFLRHGVFNIYSYLIDNKEALPLKENFVYFPLTYLTLGAYQAVVAPLMGSGFDSWLSNADSFGVVTSPNIFKYLIILKLPYLILDIVVAFILLKYFDDEATQPNGRGVFSRASSEISMKRDKKIGKKAFTLWLFNPFTIFIIYAFGNVDIFPVILVLLSLLFIKKDKKSLAALMLGLAAGFKIYPLLFVPFLCLSGESLKEKIKLAVIPFGVFGAVSLPFLSSAFLESTLISGLTTRLFNPGIGVGFGESIIVGLMLLSALFFYCLLVDKKPNMFNYFLATLLIIFAFSHFHVAWLLWIAPFLVIVAVREQKLSGIIFLLSIAAVLIPLLYQDRSMSISLFRIYSTWFDLLPTPFTAIQKFFDPYNLQSILHSLFAGGAGILVYKLFRENG